MAKLKGGTRVYGDLKIDGGIYDSNNNIGIGGSILISTGVGIGWTTNTGGLQGNQGTQGRQGTQGVQGLQGSQGIQGNQGLQGHQGTQGVQGLQGRQGTQGNQGLQGHQGTQGLQGNQGNQGLQGLVGTPTPWTVKTSNYTAVVKDQILTNTSGGSFTITLPASPSTGDYVRIGDADNWFTNNLTVARNGSTIEGLSDDFVLDIKGILVEFVYDGATWEVYSYAGPKGAQGAIGSTGPAGSGGGGEALDVLEIMLFA